jgi:ferric-dicitrate binding protein FerR (iron transport regulator)
MPTRKQRKRIQKERRHEYETVWVDGEGNELDEPPEDATATRSERRSDGRKPQQRRSSRAPRIPQPPSWRRAAKRALLLGAAVFAFVALTVHTKNGQNKYTSAAYAAVLFAALFIPYIYGIERFTYRRYQRKESEQPKKQKR